MVHAIELKKYEIFQELSESQIASLASIATANNWMEGETVFQIGASANSLYILKAGTVLLCFSDGRSFPIRNPGDAIGWSALVSPFKYTASARCLTDVTLYRFPGSEVYGLLRMDAHLGRLLMRQIAAIMEERKPYRWPGT